MAAISEFPKLVVRALAYAVRYLAAFRVEDCLRETKFFAKFTERTHMLLNSNTLTNLCVSVPFAPPTMESLLRCEADVARRLCGQGDLPEPDGLHDEGLADVDSRPDVDEVRRADATKLGWTPAR